MIYQTKASILATLLSVEGGQEPHLNAILDQIIIAREEGALIRLAKNVVNDRTQLKHQK
ncbi:MAG: hypothetical protein ABJG88_12480 [Litorimonas sp.]